MKNFTGLMNEIRNKRLSEELDNFEEGMLNKKPLNYKDAMGFFRITIKDLRWWVDNLGDNYYLNDATGELVLAKEKKKPKPVKEYRK